MCDLLNGNPHTSKDSLKIERMPRFLSLRHDFLRLYGTPVIKTYYGCMAERKLTWTFPAVKNIFFVTLFKK